MNELLPCPFCGATDCATNRDDGLDMFAVSCFVCGADGPACITEQQATSLWNTRTFVGVAQEIPDYGKGVN